MSTPNAIRRHRRSADHRPTPLGGAAVQSHLRAPGVQLLIPIIVQQTPTNYTPPTRSTRWEMRPLASVSLRGGQRDQDAERDLVRLRSTDSSPASDLRVSVFSHLMQRSIPHSADRTVRHWCGVHLRTSPPTQEFLECGGGDVSVNGTQVFVSLLVMALYGWRLALIVLVGARSGTPCLDPVVVPAGAPSSLRPGAARWSPTAWQ